MLEVIDPVYRILAEIGVPVDNEVCKTWTLLHRSVALGKFLKDCEHRTMVNECDANGYTPLHIAVLMGRNDIVSALLECNADPDSQDLVLGYSPLHFACKLGNQQIINILMSYKNPADLELLSKLDGTPLLVALHNQQFQTAHILIEKYQANVDAVDVYRRTCFHIISYKVLDTADLQEGSQMVMHLMNAKSDKFDAKDSKGRTPLHIAVAMGNFYIASNLIGLEADVNAVDSLGRTPMHYAVGGLLIGVDSSLSSCLTLLIKNGCDFNRKANDGRTPLDIAEELRAKRTWHGGERIALDVATTILKRGPTKTTTHK